MSVKISKIGIKSIDNHHKKIKKTINLLSNIIENETYNSKNLSDFFYKFIFCIEDYFTDEELLYKSYSYPYLLELKKEHSNFIKKFNKIKHNYINDSKETCYKLDYFLNNWYNSYIINYNEDATNFLLFSLNIYKTEDSINAKYL